MYLLKFDEQGELGLTADLQDNIPPYAILSHTWGDDADEVHFQDIARQSFKHKAGYAKIRFCGEQAKRDGLQYFWVDTCSINRPNFTEYAEAINSMFRWYRDAAKCYVYLVDVAVNEGHNGIQTEAWRAAFRTSRWFTRGWTLQELLAPSSVEFFSRDEVRLGDKSSLEQEIHETTAISVTALRGLPLSRFSVDERMRWAAKRVTKKPEDRAYCLIGIFDISMPIIYGEGNKALGRLQQAVDAADKATGLERQHKHWHVARPSNALFTGREDILHALEKSIRIASSNEMPTEPCRIVISGMGGQGKSEICLQLAQRLRWGLWGVFWVDVSTPSMAENGFLSIAHRLQLPAPTWEGAKQELASNPKPWVLVLDNADDPNYDYQDYFPSGTSGVVVLTTRNAEFECFATADFVPLDGLPREEATNLLLKAVGCNKLTYPTIEDDAGRVADVLQSHPLALVQAGAYIARGHCTLAKYPDFFESQRKQLLQFRRKQAKSRYGDVYATFEASVEVLQASKTEAAQDALQLLPVLAMYGPNQVPLVLFEAASAGAENVEAPPSDDRIRYTLSSWQVAHLPPVIHARFTAKNSFRLLEAANELKALALISTDTTDDGQVRATMHPLVHAWARDRQSEQQLRESWIVAGCALACSNWAENILGTHIQQLLPHIQILLSWDMGWIFDSGPAEEIVQIAANCGDLLVTLGDYKTLGRLLDGLCTRLGLDQSAVDVRWAELHQFMGYGLQQCDLVLQSIAVLEQVNEIYKTTLAATDLKRLASQLWLATSYRRNGQVKESILLLEDVVRIHKETLPETHRSRSIAQHELAMSYRRDGQIQESITLLEEVVNIEARTLSETHPDRIISWHALAISYRENGQLKESISLLEKVIRTRLQILPKNHPNQLRSQLDLAVAYRRNGQILESVSLLEEVVRIGNESLSETNHDRLDAQHELATSYQANGQIQESISLLEGVVRIRQQTLSETHPSRLASQNALANLLCTTGDCFGATPTIPHIVDISIRGKDSTQILSEELLTPLDEDVREGESLEGTDFTRVSVDDGEMK